MVAAIAWQGDYLGEKSLKTGEPTNASVVCLSAACKLVRLDRAAFDRLLGPLDKLLQVRPCTVALPHPCTVATRHACTRASVHPRAVARLHACTLASVHPSRAGAQVRPARQ